MLESREGSLRQAARVALVAGRFVVVRIAKAWPLVILLAAFSAAAQETPEQRLGISVEKIWDRAPHNSSTDLIWYQNQLYCSFREGTSLRPGFNGAIRVIRSKDGQNWESVALLDEPHADLRDPKLSVAPSGRLMINASAFIYQGTTLMKVEPRVDFSDEEGKFPQPFRSVGIPDDLKTGMDVMWRVTWHKGAAYATLFHGSPAGKNKIHLMRSADGIGYAKLQTLPVPVVDNPAEGTLRFLSTDAMVALIRCNTQTGTKWGIAKPPYTDWAFKVTEREFAEPDLLWLPDNLWVAAGRERRATGTGSVVRICRLLQTTGLMLDYMTLPGGGDCGAPGMAVDDRRNRLLISYHSTHDGKTAIYLATLRIERLHDINP